MSSSLVPRNDLLSPNRQPTKLTLNEQVYETLRDEITSGMLRPGDRLVRRSISKRLGVSPAPVTEALLRLETDGLVEFEVLCGSRVKPLRMKDVDNDQVLREAIECQAVRSCTQNATNDQIARLLIEAKPLDRIIAKGTARSRVGLMKHLDFHVLLAEYSGYSCLAEELKKVWLRQAMRLNWLGASWHRDTPKEWHEHLMKIISQRDPDRAEAVMREHVGFGKHIDRTQLARFLEEELTPKPRR